METVIRTDSHYTLALEVGNEHFSAEMPQVMVTDDAILTSGFYKRYKVI
jgi:hypothetical protein